QGWSQVNLQNYYPECIYTLDFSAMVQRNNFSGFSRSVRRLDGLRGYPPSCDDAPPAAESYPERKFKNVNLVDTLVSVGSESDRGATVMFAAAPIGFRRSFQYWRNYIIFGLAATLFQESLEKEKTFSRSCVADVLKQAGRAHASECPRAGGSEEFLSAHTLDVEDPVPEEDCSICREPLCQPSAYAGSGRVVRLRRCGHPLHHACLVAMCQSSPQAGHLQCPVCKALHGVKSGNQPPGHMSCTLLPVSLPGYEGCGTIRVNYHISPGIQVVPLPPHAEHCTTPLQRVSPRRRRRRRTSSSASGRRRRRLTGAQSTTTGEEDTVTWNEIHQKTQMHGGAHGYPDPSYLDRLLAELADHGVLPPDMPADPRPPPPPQQSLLVPKQEPLSPPKQE
ncbi:unnamed protein product, partial [Ixodes pacificus]